MVPVLKMLDAVMRLIELSDAKRPSAVAVYLEPWHADIFDFVQMKSVRGSEDNKARRLFHALWVNDLL
jgi:ribonucleotide reductase alpha subunit